MSKEEWVEWFQAVNGRNPLPEEFMAAKANGDFVQNDPLPRAQGLADLADQHLANQQGGFDDKRMNEPVSEVPTAGEPLISPETLDQLKEKTKIYSGIVAEKVKDGASLAAGYAKEGVGVTATYIKDVKERQEQASFRDTGSYFDGSVLEYIIYSLGVAFFMILTFGLGLPWALCAWKKWEVRHTIIGGRRLRFDGTGLQLFGNWIKWWFLTLITFGIYGFWVYVRLMQWVTKHTHFADER